MYSIAEIKEKLVARGFKEEETNQVIKDVFSVIVLKLAEDQTNRLDKDTVNVLEAMEPEELKSYLKEMPAKVPKILQEKFGEIYKNTWDDYFESTK